VRVTFPHPAATETGRPDRGWVAEGDEVAAPFTMRGTHLGAFFGVPSTWKKIEVQAMTSIVFRTGKSSKNEASPIFWGCCSKSALC